MTQEEIRSQIEKAIPGAQVNVHDMTGTADHYQVVVIAPGFEGKSMIDQHRMVKNVFDGKIASGELHALSLKTFTPKEWEKRGNR